MSASNSPDSAPLPHEPAAGHGSLRGRSGTDGPGLNIWGWLALALFVTSGAAILIMLVLKWFSGGGEVWPWFTRYAYFAFPGAFLCLLLSLLQTLVQRRRA